MTFPTYERNVMDPEAVKARAKSAWQMMAEELVAAAAKDGFEVTIEWVPKKPLAMRNKEPKVTITERR